MSLEPWEEEIIQTENALEALRPNIFQKIIWWITRPWRVIKTDAYVFGDNKIVFRYKKADVEKAAIASVTARERFEKTNGRPIK